MGGSAFGSILQPTAFPRIPPPIYQALKGSFLSKLQEFYECVGVPTEAPEKLDHGDLDFLAAIPKAPFTDSSVPHECIRDAICATYMNPMEGNRTSNYAVPIKPGAWAEFGFAGLEHQCRKDVENGEIYYQVDVHVCYDKDEWDRTMFFHSYGDMGMILGLISRNVGLALGVKGLKIPDPPNPPFDLSEHFEEIAEFLGLSMQRYNEGFETKRDVFEWAASIRFFDPSQFKSQGPGISKVKPERKMYAEFVEWVVAMRQEPSQDQTDRLSRQDLRAPTRDVALAFFGKKGEFEALAKARSDRLKLKGCFSGSVVHDWAEMGGYWKGVKLIMDEVRARMGGEEGILKFLEGHSENDLKKAVLQVKSDLGIVISPEVLQAEEQAPLLMPSSSTSGTLVGEIVVDMKELAMASGKDE
ncbi:hypothetical protein NLJ89_g8179 [Agrocybe chaxingu]|uniref:Uncharacterized protein n=1 Tax=Agrocybe chaxingu TaxID=84603 RepID=A0A9W8MUC3_9AGAR|nr:hypothetical protein NLJ89_g8179 [Agrocybe chaxingu]